MPASRSPLAGAPEYASGMIEEKNTGPWIWIGLGCCVAAFGIAVVAAALLFFGAREVRQFEEDMNDPANRERKVLEILGASELPDGYYPMIGLSLPFVFDMAVLTSDPPQPDGSATEDLGEHSFIYFKTLGRADQEEELYDFFEGKTNDPEVLRRQRINVRVDKLLDRGVIERDDTSILWVAHEGTFGIGGSGFQQGIAGLMIFQCSGQRRIRMGIWLGPAAEQAEGEELDLTGTAADPDAIEALVRGFRPCS